MTSPPRVDVFIDYSNMYIGARELFGRMGDHWRHTPGTRTAPPATLRPDFGHFDPRGLAQHLADRTPPGAEPRALGQVHVFRGEPDRLRNPGLWEHFRRAVDRWEAAGVQVSALPCVYRHDTDRMVEKGIDVALALEALAGAFHDRYDVAIIASADQDLLPLVRMLAGDGLPATVEVAAWAGEGYGSATILGVAGVIEHRLPRAVFEGLRVSNWDGRRPPEASPG